MTNHQIQLPISSNPLDIAWAAGLFEGEGTMRVYPRMGTKNLQVLMRLAMTDKDVVERYAAVIGVGRVGSIVRAKSPSTAHLKVCFYCDLYGAKVAPLLRLFLPYFGVRRRERALSVLEVAMGLPLDHKDRVACPRGHPYSGANLYVYRGSRFCKTCRNAAQVAYAEKVRVAA